MARAVRAVLAALVLTVIAIPALIVGAAVSPLVGGILAVFGLATVSGAGPAGPARR